MLRRHLSLLMAPMLTTALALAIAVPVNADRGAGRGDECPCWDKRKAKRVVRHAFAEVGSENFVCDSEIDVRGVEESANADFVVFDGPVGEPGLSRELDLEASLSTVGGEVERGFCSIEDAGGFLVREKELTQAEAEACVQILGKICVEKKKEKKSKKKGKKERRR